jgi:hypothetical protein
VTGSMAAMYGMPPMPGRGRDAVDDVVEAVRGVLNVAVPTARPAPEHHKMHWNGVEFTWDGRCFQGSGAGWAAQVFPDGLLWKGSLQVYGGMREAIGSTPGDSLDEARKLWQAAVGALGLGTESPC